MNRLLLLGALTNKKDNTQVGGVTVLFELLLEELRDREIPFTVIDTYKENYPNIIYAYIAILVQFIKNVNTHTHISIQATNNLLIYIGPIIILISKVLSKKISIRKFAGNFNDIYENANPIKKKLIKYVLSKSDVNFFETKYLVEYFQGFNQKIYWFPNVRRQQLIPKLPREYKKRFVYIGTINEEKGIDELCAAIKLLSSEYIVDIYGPIKEPKYLKNYFENLSVSYKGALKSTDVINTLNNYDVLILPSHREGYPGVIIEAFSLGIPVIATKLEGILEMVEDNKNGFLFNTGNIEQLVKCIENTNMENYDRLSLEAQKSFVNFNSDIQTNNFLKRIEFL